MSGADAAWVQRLAEHVARQPAPDAFADVTDPHGRPILLPPRPPATHAAWHSAEEALGYPLPDLLGRMYSEVGDGQFGPGYGLLALTAHTTSTAGMVPSALAWRSEFGFDRAWLPLCYWGCTVYSFLEVSSGRVGMIDVGIEDDLQVVQWQAASLGDFLQAWMDGHELFFLDEPAAP
ncbi:SMI1/KNR4 family protein [Deinococcus sp.]|uniref:SMI1/KNR4 family protein n=1 Tax=Deinococcus sp. TaxID=47478 RepID=UPI003CC534A4